jgi:hypothetical protein
LIRPATFIALTGMIKNDPEVIDRFHHLLIATVERSS